MSVLQLSNTKYTEPNFVSKKKKKRETLTFYAFISPFIIGFSLFTIFPIVMSFIFSLNKISILNYAANIWQYMGLKNYKDILFGDNMFFVAMKNTFMFAFLRVGITMLISLLLALLLNKNIFGEKFLRTLIYVPAVLPVVGAAVLWKQIFDGNYSILSYLFNKIGIHISPQFWLGRGAIFSAIIMSVFMNLGPTMILILAGLQGVPKDLEEAAKIDGANSVVRFFKIVLPFISSVLFFVSITNFIGSLQVYAEVDLLIGQINNSSMTMSYLAMFYYKDTTIGLSYSSAVCWLIFIIVMIFTAIYFKLSDNKIFYAGE